MLYSSLFYLSVFLYYVLSAFAFAALVVYYYYYYYYYY